jgi:hypothetical protein
MSQRRQKNPIEWMEHILVKFSFMIDDVKKSEKDPMILLSEAKVDTQDIKQISMYLQDLPDEKLKLPSEKILKLLYLYKGIEREVENLKKNPVVGKLDMTEMATFMSYVFSSMEDCKLAMTRFYNVNYSEAVRQKEQIRKAELFRDKKLISAMFQQLKKSKEFAKQKMEHAMAHSMAHSKEKKKKASELIFKRWKSLLDRKKILEQEKELERTRKEQRSKRAQELINSLQHSYQQTVESVREKKEQIKKKLSERKSKSKERQEEQKRNRQESLEREQARKKQEKLEKERHSQARIEMMKKQSEILEQRAKEVTTFIQEFRKRREEELEKREERRSLKPTKVTIRQTDQPGVGSESELLNPLSTQQKAKRIAIIMGFLASILIGGKLAYDYTKVSELRPIESELKTSIDSDQDFIRTLLAIATDLQQRLPELDPLKVGTIVTSILTGLGLFKYLTTAKKTKLLPKPKKRKSLGHMLRRRV